MTASNDQIKILEKRISTNMANIQTKLVDERDKGLKNTRHLAEQMIETERDISKVLGDLAMQRAAASLTVVAAICTGGVLLPFAALSGAMARTIPIQIDQQKGNQNRVVNYMSQLQSILHNKLKCLNESDQKQDAREIRLQILLLEYSKNHALYRNTHKIRNFWVNIRHLIFRTLPAPKKTESDPVATPGPGRW